MEDSRLVGSITQSMKWSKTRKATQKWEVSSEGNVLTFIVEGVLVMKHDTFLSHTMVLVSIPMVNRR